MHQDEQISQMLTVVASVINTTDRIVQRVSWIEQWHQNYSLNKEQKIYKMVSKISDLVTTKLRVKVQKSNFTNSTIFNSYFLFQLPIIELFYLN